MTKPSKSPETERWKEINFFHGNKLQGNTQTILVYLNWHGRAARWDFGDQTESLIMDTFIQNTNNKTVQQKLCTEPKNDPQESFQFAIAYEEGINQHRAFEGGSALKEVKNEPLCAVNERRNPCSRFGLEFSQNHLAVSKAKNERCRNCALIGHFARMCKKPNTGNIRGQSRYAAE